MSGWISSISCLPCECNCACCQDCMQGSSEEEGISDDLQLSPLLLSAEATNREASPLLMRDMNAVPYSLDASNYDIQTLVGNGYMFTSTVSSAKHRPNGHLVAIKRTYLENKSVDLEEIQHEVLLTRQLSHKNLLPFFCAFTFNGELWIVMPYMAYGSAKDLLQYPFAQGMPELLVAFILHSILQALEYIHKRGMIHRSVKASHILISAKGQVCLTGLRYSYDVMQNGRLSKYVHDFSPKTVRNLNWLSPEVLEQNLQGYSNKSDVYSVGIVACELANGAVPFAHMPPTQMLLEKLQGPMPLLLDSNTCKLLETEEQQAGVIEGLPLYFKERIYTDGFHQIVSNCLEKDFLMRPSVANLLSNSFFKQCKRSNVSLCNLLHSLMPAVENVKQNQNGTTISDTLVDAVSNKLEEVSVEEDSWNF